MASVVLLSPSPELFPNRKKWRPDVFCVILPVRKINPVWLLAFLLSPRWFVSSSIRRRMNAILTRRVKKQETANLDVCVSAWNRRLCVFAPWMDVAVREVAFVSVFGVVTSVVHGLGVKLMRL